MASCLARGLVYLRRLVSQSPSSITLTSIARHLPLLFFGHRAIAKTSSQSHFPNKATITMRFFAVAVTALAAMPLGLADRPRPDLRRPDSEFEIRAKIENTRIETRPGVETRPRVETTPAQRIKPNEDKSEKQKADDPNTDLDTKKNSKKNSKTNTNTCPVVPVLTQKIVCDNLGIFADDLDAIYDLVKPLQCGETKDYCWIPVRQALYDLEFKLDAFDKLIDESDLTKCFECRDESKIACCYRRVSLSLAG